MKDLAQESSPTEFGKKQVQQSYGKNPVQHKFGNDEMLAGLDWVSYLRSRNEFKKSRLSHLAECGPGMVCAGGGTAEEGSRRVTVASLGRRLQEWASASVQRVLHRPGRLRRWPTCRGSRGAATGRRSGRWSGGATPATGASV